MAKRKRDPLFSISRWVSDKDDRAEFVMTLIIVGLVAALLWRQ